MWPWKYFQPHEVLSPVGIEQYERGNLLFQPFALDAFDELRRFLKKPLYANHAWLTLRGYRSPQENSRAGGASLSRHIQGIALDVTCDELKSYELFQAVKEIAPELGFGGIGHYADSNFVHIDCRPILDKPITWGDGI